MGDLSASASQDGCRKGTIWFLTIFIEGSGGVEQLETTIRKMEEKNKGKSNLPWRRHRRTQRGRRKVGNTTRIRQTRKALSTTGGYSESRTPIIDDQTLNCSSTLAHLAHTSTTPMFWRVRTAARI